jgi:hypothetical protein
MGMPGVQMMPSGVSGTACPVTSLIAARSFVKKAGTAKPGL